MPRIRGYHEAVLRGQLKELVEELKFVADDWEDTDYGMSPLLNPQDQRPAPRSAEYVRQECAAEIRNILQRLGLD